ncbi:hypothetical protein B7494_g281 [Chlorociboria aeruginascens]|nr:hypothetical protein B7494_g281 [Chlorociboria aeruginascens]
MTGKRKRKRPGRAVEGDVKRQKISASAIKEPVVKQELLARYYSQVFSLRQYLLSKLPSESKVRRKKITSVGRKHSDGRDGVLAEFLDKTLIGLLPSEETLHEERWKRWNVFTQRGDTSTSTVANPSGVGIYSQSEIVDFSIWLIFSQSHKSNGNISHLLCQGFRRDFSAGAVHRDENLTSAIPGLACTHPNSHVMSMKQPQWTWVLALMGKEGERMMIDLILDCGIFVSLEGGCGSYYQLSGLPLGDLQVLSSKKDDHPRLNVKRKSHDISVIHTPGSIRFVRNRIMYARAALNSQGAVLPGLRHIHVLNRHPLEKPDSYVNRKPEAHSTTLRRIPKSTVHVMMYIFPRQFRLHNVFTSDVNSFQTSQPLKDYTLREDEIKKKFPSTVPSKVPRRLRGVVIDLVRKLQVQHSRCPYKMLLEYYCPIRQAFPDESTIRTQEGSTGIKTQVSKSSCSSGLSAVASAAVIPPKETTLTDQATPTSMVSAFCRAVLSKLIPHGFWGSGRVQVENKHVFFRNVDRFIALGRFESLTLHEVSQGLKLTMFEELKLEHAQNILKSRELGFSQVRLVPKETGVRPIMNLKHRPMKDGYKNILGRSINSIMAPVYNVLTFEKNANPNRLGSTIFSVSDMYMKLKTFKSSIQVLAQPLYFAKVDVKGAFDTIPQRAVINLMSSLPTQSSYCIAKHVEIKPRGGKKRWISLAKAPGNLQTFEDLATEIAVGKKNTIFVENVAQETRSKEEVLDLLVDHIQCNMVKIGKKFYRQKEGIPQGSVISSLLCNYFYADLEAQHLHFLQVGNSLLLRLMDDFLLITTDRIHAKRFLQIMHNGLPEYGVRVNPDKTLVNFEVSINERKITRLVGSRTFPYCGSFIDTKTLDISKDRERKKNMAILDSLTVEFSQIPGKTFHKKVLDSFKIQAHAMFLDTSFNSLATVLSNVHSAFIESATKMWTYNRCLPSGKQPGRRLIISTSVPCSLILAAGRKQTDTGKPRNHRRPSHTRLLTSEKQSEE